MYGGSGFGGGGGGGAVAGAGVDAAAAVVATSPPALGAGAAPAADGVAIPAASRRALDRARRCSGISVTRAGTLDARQPREPRRRRSRSVATQRSARFVHAEIAVLDNEAPVRRVGGPTGPHPVECERFHEADSRRRCRADGPTRE